MLIRRSLQPADRFYFYRNLRKHRSPSEQSSAEPSLDDLLQREGVQLPAHLSSRPKRWVSLLLVAFTGAFASGPVASWPTLQPLLIEEGVFAGPNQNENLASVFSIAWGASLIAIFWGGIMYDTMGPKVVAVVGALGACVSLVVMGLSIKFQYLNSLLWVAYPAATVFGFVNSLGCYAWLWLLPDEQNSVNASTGAVQALADSMVLFAVFLHSKFGLPLSTYFLLAAGLTLLGTIVQWMLVPSRQENARVAAVVLAGQGATDGIGATYGAVEESQRVNPPEEEESCTDILSSSLAKIKQVFACCMLNPLPICLFLAFNLFTYMQVATIWFGMYTFYSELMGKSAAIKLVNIWGGLYAVMGAVTLLLFGKLADKIGFVPLLALESIPIMVVTVLFYVPRFDAQVSAQVLVSLLSGVWTVNVPRICLSYGPPELLGTMFGLIATLLGLGQIILTPITQQVVKALLHNSQDHGKSMQALPFLLTVDVWCSLSVISALSLLVYWWHSPPPAQGSITMAAVVCKGAVQGSAALGDEESITQKRSDGFISRELRA